MCDFRRVFLVILLLFHHCNLNIVQGALTCTEGYYCLELGTPGVFMWCEIVSCLEGNYCTGNPCVMTPCPSGTYADWKGSTAASDCATCTRTTCPAGSFVDTPCGEVDLGCGTCTAGVGYTSTVNYLRSCLPCSEACSPGTYLTAACTTTLKIVCNPCSGTCSPGTYLSAACTSTSNRVC